MRENNRGITIIALVVTIIVLLILAGISIAAITGDNGIINKSDEARIETEIATYKEQLEVIKHGEYADDYTINLDDFLDKYAKAVQEDKMFREAKEVTADHENKVVIVVTKEGYRFEVTIEDTTYVGNEDGEGNTEVDISKVKITITSTPENWTRDKVKVKITSNVTRVSKEYSIDGGKSWNKYENEIEVQDNGTEIQARGVNEKNEKTEVVKKKIENIDRLAPNTFAPTIKGIKNRLEITASTIDKEATAKDGKSGIKGYKFSKDNGSNWTGLITEGKYTYENLQPGTTYPIKVKAVDNAGNEVETNTTNGTTEEEITVPDGEGRISFAKDPNEWTRGQVRVEISTREQGYGIEYSLDGSKYTSYSAPIEVSENKIIYARLTKNGKTGKSATYNVDNIDRLQPKEFVVNIQGKTTNSIVVEGNTTDAEGTQTDGSSGIRGYRFSKDGGSNWTEEQTSGRYVFTGLNAGASYELKIKAIDNAGNERETSTITEGTIQIPSGEGNIEINAIPTNWTNGNVIVEIQSRVEGYRLQYSTNGVNWSDYNGEIQISDNGTTIYARLYDGTSAGDVTSKTISNIDRLSPNTFTPAIQVTTNSITIEANTTDRPATSIDGSSGIRGYRFSKDNGYSWTGEQVSGTYTFSGLTSGTNYQVKVKAIDNAGNERETTAINETTNQLPNPAEKIQITKTPSSWTNGIVTVRITNMAQEYILQYSKDNRSWETYLSPITVVDNNETIYARLYEPNSQEATRSISTQITNIDRLSPIIFTPTVSAGIDTITVTANTADREATTIDGKSGIRGYKFSKDSGYSWTEEQVSGTYTFGRLSPGTRYQIRVKAIDNAGNEMESYEVTGTTIEIPGGNSNIYFSYSPSGWTNGNVTVTITATTSNYRLQYSKDGYSWYDYNSYQKVTMTENGPVYARLTDGVNYGTIATGNVSNIDKIAPNVNYSTNPSTGVASEVTIYINATDNLSGIGSITNTTYDNIRKINDTTYIVTANGTYYFTVTDRAGNISSKSIYISNVEEKKLRVGDYVNYIPTGAQSYYIPESYLGVAQTLYKENLEWRVLDIKDDGYVELISTTANTNINMKVARGYNNMVYVLNDVAKELYSNNSIGAIARSIKVEDVIDKINPGYDYVQKNLTYGEYLKSYTQYGSMQVPSIWKKEIGTNNSIDGVNNNGTLGRSEQNELIYEDLVTVNSYMTYTNMYFNLNADVKNNMKTVETKNSLNDSEIYYNLLVKTSGDVKAYTFATRLIFNSGGSNPSLGFGYNWGNGIYGVGMSYELINSTIKLYPMRMIVKLPKSAINIQVGTGNKGDGWGMQ